MKSLYLIVLVVLTSSCGSHLIDTTLAPTPFNAQKGDITVDASADRLGETIESSNEISGISTANLGIGYSLTEKDFLRFNTQLDAFETSSTIKYTMNLNYWRSIAKSSNNQHLVGLSLGNSNVYIKEGTSNGFTGSNNAYGLKFQYAFQYQIQSKWTLQTGANMGFGFMPIEDDQDPTAAFGSLHLGTQYQIFKNFELIADLSLNGVHNIYYDEFFMSPGFRIGGRFLLNR